MVVTSSSVETRHSRSSRLSTWSQTVLLLVIAIVAYAQTWIDIWPYWAKKNATYTHGTLVALVTLWLAWRAKPAVNGIRPVPSVRMVPVVLILSGCWVLAEKANLFIVYACLWPILAFSALWAALGLQAAARFAVPLGFLYFAIPVWDYLKPALQTITFTMTNLVAGILGIPAAFDGPYVTLPTGTIFIHEDCSGAHFLCVALAVGMLAGVLRGDDLRTRVLILVIAGLLSMAFNWLRILLIVLAYMHPVLRDAFETIGHITFGWWVFALDLIVFGLVLRFIPRSSKDCPEPQPENGINAGAPHSIAGLVTTTVALVVLPAAASTLPRLDSYPAAIPDSVLRSTTNDLNVASFDPRWTPDFPGAVWEDRFAVISAQGGPIEVYANRYHEQSQGRELISNASFLFDPLEFSAEATSVVHLRDSDDKPIAVNRITLVDNLGNRWLSLYTYFVNNEPIANSRQAQMTAAIQSLHSRPTAGIVAATSSCAGDCESRSLPVEIALIRVLENYREQFDR